MTQVKKCGTCKRYLEISEYDIFPRGDYMRVCRRCTFKRRIREQSLCVYDEEFNIMWKYIASKPKSVRNPRTEDIIPTEAKKRRRSNKSEPPKISKSQILRICEAAIPASSEGPELAPKNVPGEPSRTEPDINCLCTIF
jgi:hypothetical protein